MGSCAMMHIHRFVKIYSGIQKLIRGICRHTESTVISKAYFYFFQNKKLWEELITYFPLTWHGPYKNYAPNNYSIVVYVFFAAITFRRAVAKQQQGIQIQTQTDGKDLWSTPLGWVYMPWYTKFHKDWFRHSKGDMDGGFTDSRVISETFF
jgi:hypothetical protein